MMIFLPLSIAGEALPHSLRNDDLVTGALLVCFLLMAHIAAGSWGFVRNYSKNFLRPRERENLFVADDEGKFRGSLPLLVLTAFLISLLFFRYLQVQMPAVVAASPPGVLLGLITGILLLYYLLKLALYAIINGIFFSPGQRGLWQQDYLLNVFAFGFALFPLVLAVVYVGLSCSLTRLLLIALLVVLKSLLLYRCGLIFFYVRSRCLHLFLYFCTLELAPLLFLWRLLLFASNSLTTIY